MDNEPITGPYIPQSIPQGCVGLFHENGLRGLCSDEYYYGFLAGVCSVATNTIEPMSDFLKRSWQLYEEDHKKGKGTDEL